MYITEIASKKASGKVFKTILLRKSFREDGKVKNKTIANLSCCNGDEINIFKEFLNKKGKGVLIDERTIQTTPGKSLGSIVVLYEIAHRLGIVEALGTSFHGKLTLWLVFARILEQRSRLSATRLDSKYDISSVINLGRGFDENNLYDCLHWLNKNQDEIENYLFHRKKKSKDFFWYDVTSSYFEGQCNELAAFGYNRDKKKQKRIVVIGLLCQEKGDPVSIEAFQGNTQDTQTFENQLIKLKNRFHCKSITVVSDRGLIRDKQKALLSQYNFHYITALPMTQIRPLLSQGVLKCENFVDELKSLQHENQRLIYRRNLVRAEEAKNAREDRFQTVQDKVNQENKRLSTALKASLAVSKKKIQSMIDKYELSTWVSVSRIKRKFVLHVDEEKLKEKSAFDGCYVWVTDWKESELSNQEVYQYYKDLKYIEDDFKCIKTSFLEIRPIFVRSEASTRGHLLVIMLAHMILRELRKSLNQFNNTVEEVLGELNKLCRTVVKIGEREINTISTPNSTATQFLKAVGVKMPTALAEVNVPVVSRHHVRKNVNF